jgi:long-chain acyl-CoA synthetase
MGASVISPDNRNCASSNVRVNCMLGGPGSKFVPDDTISECGLLLETILAQGRQRGSETAIVDDRGEVSFSQLRFAGSIMLGHLNRCHRRTERFGILIPQSAGCAIAFLAARLSNRVPVMLNFLLKPSELVDICRDAQLELVVSIAYFKEHNSALRQAGLEVMLMDEQSFRRIPWPRRIPKRQPDDTAVILYTSGTSATPKGVMLTNNNLDSNAHASIAHARFNQQMTFLGVLPMFHALGLMATCLIPLSLGCKVVYITRFNPSAVVDAVRKHGVQVLVAVPTMYAILAHSKAATRDALASVQYAISGGEPLPVSLIDEYQQRFGIPLLEGFGLTETSPMVSFNVPWDWRPGSVGKPIPGVEINIKDDLGRDLPAGESGELWVRGPNVMKGYYNRPQETSEVLTADGWFQTGDIARQDTDGFLYITGRKKDLIIMGGEKIVPSQIEEVLRQFPGVMLAAVVGVKDAQRGEVPVAFIQWNSQLSCRPSPHELRTFVCQSLAAYKAPREFYYVDAMPLTPTGKISKRHLLPPAPATAHALP